MFLDKQGVGSVSQFIEYQDAMIDLVKKECAAIEPKMSTLGNVSYDMPQNMKRQKGSARPRKDNYSALFLGVWATKLYLDAQEAPEVNNDYSFTPFLI